MQEKILYVQDFAELGAHFDRPVAGYSAGMRARLAFGTSMAFDFDFYLIDEVMAVGDVSFRKKSRRVFKERMKKSKIILVSHNMKTISNMCDAAVFLENGQATYYDDVREGIAAYEQTGEGRAVAR